MFELFPDQPVYEYPELINITYSLLWAFLLSSIIAITHRFTFTGEDYPKNFFQALILGSIVTAMVMMAVGDSLARGLGVFGAMAIIRFRTRINDPRNVLFLFAALSTGLAVGVYGFTISFVGTIIFCSIAFILHASPFRSFTQNSFLFFTLTDSVELPAVLIIVQKYCTESRSVSVFLTKENSLRYQYSVSMRKNAAKDGLIKELMGIKGIKQIKIEINQIEINPL